MGRLHHTAPLHNIYSWKSPAIYDSVKTYERHLQITIPSHNYGQSISHQYCFIMGHSTIVAVQEVIEHVQITEDRNNWSHLVAVLATLDVRHAYNSTRWTKMCWVLDNTFQIISYFLRNVNSYLMNRVLLYVTLEGQH